MKPEVNLTHNPYDILLKKEPLRPFCINGSHLNLKIAPHHRQIIRELYMQKKLLSLEHEGFEVVVFLIS